jgi:hypothetical protein
MPHAADIGTELRTALQVLDARAARFTHAVRVNDPAHAVALPHVLAVEIAPALRGWVVAAEVHGQCGTVGFAALVDELVESVFHSDYVLHRFGSSAEKSFVQLGAGPLAGLPSAFA